MGYMIFSMTSITNVNIAFVLRDASLSSMLLLWRSVFEFAKTAFSKITLFWQLMNKLKVYLNSFKN